jgi:hypothetical protein
MVKTRQQKGGCLVGRVGVSKGCAVGKKAPRRDPKIKNAKKDKSDSDSSKDYKPPKKRKMVKKKAKPMVKGKSKPMTKVKQPVGGMRY